MFGVKNLTFEGLLHEMAPVLGLGNTEGRGFKPHSDKTHVAIGDPDGALGKGLGYLIGSYTSWSPKDRKVKVTEQERERERV